MGHRSWLVVLGVLASMALPDQSVIAQNLESNRRAHLAEGIPITAHLSTLPHAPRISSGFSRSGSAISSAFDVTYYHLTLNLDRSRSPLIIGRVRVEGAALQDLETIELDLNVNMVVDVIFAESGQSLEFVHQADLLTITTPSAVSEGMRFAFDVVYHGTPQNQQPSSFVAGTRNGGQSYIWTLSEPYGGREWWPSEDHPSDKADSVRVTVTVPEPMVVGSNGLLESEIHHDNGTVTFDWVHRYPIASYLVSLAAGVYERRTDLYRRSADLAEQFGNASFPIVHFWYPDVPAYQGISAASGWRLTSDAMEELEDWFGPYPFSNEKYGNAHVTFRGGMEHQTMSSMGNIGIELISHELAHQWFGDQLTPLNWKDLWLNEGFATLGEMLVFESHPDYAGVQDILSDVYFNRALNAAGTLVLQDTTSVTNMFAFSRVYGKGWMVLRMIRGMVGDETFRAILRTYTAAEDLAYGNSRTEDFKKVVEQVSSRSFDTFFEQWVTEGTGYPRYEAVMEDISIPPMYRARITLRQTQEIDESNVSVFEMPVWLQVNTAGANILVLVENDAREQVYELDVPEQPESVLVDPERWILRSAVSLATEIESDVLPRSALSVDVYPNPARSTIQFSVKAPVSARPVAELYDLLGRRIWSRPLGRADGGAIVVRVDDIELAPGAYMLRVRDGENAVDRVVTLHGHR